MGEDESHPLASLIEIVGVLIENYENEHVPEWRWNDFATEDLEVSVSALALFPSHSVH
jgi:hypothetical protein